MRVIATGKGHCGKQLREVGDVFDFSDKKLKKDGKGDVVFPSWFVRDSNEERAKAQKQLQADGEQQQKEAEEILRGEAEKKAAQQALLKNGGGTDLA